MRISLALLAAAAVITTTAQAREFCVLTKSGKTACGEPATATGSVYGHYGVTAFVRGGYDFFGKNSRQPNSAGTPYFAVGARTPISFGPHWSVEGEFLTFKDSETAFIGLGDATVGTRGIVGLISLRWQGESLGWGFEPFVSAGFGPGRYKSSFSDGRTTITSSDVGLAYSGRVGVEKTIFNKVSLEAAYRYLNATADAAVGQHSGELGLNYRF